MILFFIDILIYNLTSFNTFLVLLNLLNKENKYKLIIIALILDLIIFNTYFKNIIVILVLILINKYLLNYKNTIVNYLSINILNYTLFIIITNLINFNFSFTNISSIIIDNFLINIIIWLICYKYTKCKHDV